MGFLSFIKNLFGHGKQRQEKTQNDPLDNVVRAYLDDKLINIPLVPNFIEKQIYRSLLEMMLAEVRNAANGNTINDDKTDMTRPPVIFPVLGHGISFSVSPSVADSMCGIRRRNLSKRTAKELQEQRTIVQSYANKFIKNEDVDIPWMPEFAQRKIYANVLELVLGILQDTLHTSAIDLMGHRLTFSLSAAKSRSKPQAPQLSDTPCEDCDHATTAAIDNLVEEHMKKSNIALLPDFVERTIYKRAFRIVVGVLREVVCSCRIYVLDHTVTLGIDPRAMQ